ncbi:hypothetical protein CONCODRAFT_5331 [Conidiobolus coronatus NRRL 28638]|uniref:Thioesterase domain-containing protein n=1 Tax=Conidiobolus coronatus (strain ATCC 28846 / CBS 209.66 / NRRL 28638) TaxID=796925 RepID=A0A137PA95_CONC2|nr:hypothetical protein CONCODRAFT_5331 [Conidiobolus coronatus NRRL 28638]|eukprot:KXN71910.1 hypothetical protein CONCODRAFT_5331 [Conidiobolus coronatus NRRL 28638]
MNQACSVEVNPTRKSVRNTRNSNLIPLSNEIQLELENFPSVITVPIQWGNQDSYRALSHVDWFGMAHSGRIDYCSMLGLYMDKEEAKHLTQGSGSGRGLAIKNYQMKFMCPMFYPDAMTIASKVTKLEAGRVEMLSRFYSHKNNCLAGEGTILVYCFDYTKSKKVDFTPETINAIKELEADPLKAQELALNTPFRTLSNY